MLSDDQVNQVQNRLFSDERQNIYAVVDGAACPDLRFNISKWNPESSCLWSGDLDADLEEVAPYMIKLERDADFTQWLIKEGWENHWNIFVSSILEPKAFRKEIRKFQLARLPEGETVYFRFYDPRVLEMFLPTCDEMQRHELFTHIEVLYFSAKAKLQLAIARKGSKGGVIEYDHLSNRDRH